MWVVYNAEGGIVPGLADRNGIRYSTSRIGSHSGAMVKKEECDEMGWLEAGAKDAVTEMQNGLFGLTEK